MHVGMRNRRLRSIICILCMAKVLHPVCLVCFALTVITYPKAIYLGTVSRRTARSKVSKRSYKSYSLLTAHVLQ